jgi:hypothetical protein
MAVLRTTASLIESLMFNQEEQILVQSAAQGISGLYAFCDTHHVGYNNSNEISAEDAGLPFSL